MTYAKFSEEFIKEIVTQTYELQRECSKMTEIEFNSYRIKVMERVRRQKKVLSEKFMTIILNIIYNNLFQSIS